MLHCCLACSTSKSCCYILDKNLCFLQKGRASHYFSGISCYFHPKYPVPSLPDFAQLLSWLPTLPESIACPSVMLFTLSMCLWNSYAEDFQGTLNSYYGLDFMCYGLSLQCVLLFFFCPTRFPSRNLLCLLLWLMHKQYSINLHLVNDRVI